MATLSDASAALSAQIIASIITAEGGDKLSTDRNDPGNWTGGAIGKGKLVGTRYGISAASYPTLDIPNLTLAQATAIIRANYWVPVMGDQLSPHVVAVLCDSAVNQGRPAAVKLLQESLGVADDGIFGIITLKAAQAADPDDLAIELIARRAVRYAGTAGFNTYGLGWMRRLARNGWGAATIAT